MSGKVVVKDTNVQLTVYKTFYTTDYSKLEQLEQGGDGCCYKTKCPTFGKIVFKIFNSPKLLNIQNNREIREIQTLLQVNAHPNVIRLFGLVEDNRLSLPSTIGYAMEYMQGGSLHSVINSPMMYSECDAYKWIFQAGRGLNYLHEHSIIHKDVKPQNMLLNGNYGELKISDFGCCKSLDATTISKARGTPPYMAPELFSNGFNMKFGIELDVYALGISIWEIFHRKKLYGYTIEGRPTIRENLHGPTREIIERCELEFEKKISRCWKQKPEERCKVMDVIVFAEALYEEKRSNKKKIEQMTTPNTRGQTLPAASFRQPNNAIRQFSTPFLNPDVYKTAKIPAIPHRPAANLQRPDQPPVSSKNSQQTDVNKQKAGTSYETPRIKKLPPPIAITSSQTASPSSASAPLNPSTPEPRAIHTSPSFKEERMSASIAELQLYRYFQVYFFAQTKENFDRATKGIREYFSLCGEDIKMKKGYAFSPRMRFFALGPEGIILNPEEIGQQNLNTIGTKDFGSLLDFTRFTIIFWFNLHTSSIETLNRISMYWRNIEKLEQIYSIQGTRITAAVSEPEFKCLIIGSSHLNSREFVQDIQKRNYPLPRPYNILQLYKMRYFHMDIPGDRLLTTCTDLIWNQIHRLELIHCLCFLVDASADYDSFGEQWNTLSLANYSVFCLICDKNESIEENKFKSKFSLRSTGDIIAIPKGNPSVLASHFTRSSKIYEVFHRMYAKCIDNLVRHVTPLVAPEDWRNEPAQDFR